MMEVSKVVCLVGSTQVEWKARYRRVEQQLTHAGFVVVSVVWFRGDLPNIDACGKQGCKDFEGHRELLERIHRKKIRISDAVVLIHEAARGEHTKEEIEFALSLGKPVVTFENIDQAIRELNGKIGINKMKEVLLDVLNEFLLLRAGRNQYIGKAWYLKIKSNLEWLIGETTS